MERGWAVAEASDGREALVHALSGEPSIVVTELWVPLIDGLALCQMLRRDAATSEMPIVVVTSETRASYLQHAARAGADAVLIKPSTPDVIVAEVDRLTQATVAPRFVEFPKPRQSLAKQYQRFETATPNEPAPDLVCPICTQPLVYQKTFFGGVSRRIPNAGTISGARAAANFPIATAPESSGSSREALGARPAASALFSWHLGERHAEGFHRLRQIAPVIRVLVEELARNFQTVLVPPFWEKLDYHVAGICQVHGVDSL